MRYDENRMRAIVRDEYAAGHYLRLAIWHPAASYQWRASSAMSATTRPRSSRGWLIGVSAQSIYNWERNVSKPRDGQLVRLSALRGIGKREATERLKQLRSMKSSIRRKT